MASPTTPGTSTVAKADSDPGIAAGRADALTDLREDVKEDEAKEEGLHQGAHDELDPVLAENQEVAPDEGTEGSPAGRRGRAGRPQLDVTRGRGSRRTFQGRASWWLPSVAQVLSGQPDEHCLERGLGDVQVGQRETGRLRRFDDPGHQAFRAPHLELDAALNGASP